MDVLSKDPEIEKLFWHYHGPKNESTISFFRRGFTGFCNTIASPKRLDYNNDNLQVNGYNVREFQIFSNNYVLFCCLWKNLINIKSNRCIIYLHTNTRNLCDALELIPLCNILQSHLVSFDLPGFGKSEGTISPDMYKDLDVLIDWINCLLGDNIEIIIWARGLSTALALEYCAKKQINDNECIIMKNNLQIKFLVLDSPYESVKKMIRSCIKKLEGEGYQLPNAVLSIFSNLARNVISNRLNGMDPYSVEPIVYADKINIPSIIFSALKDDYIPPDQTSIFAEKWVGECTFKTILQGHFGVRPVEDVISTANIILRHLNNENHLA